MKTGNRFVSYAREIYHGHRQVVAALICLFTQKYNIDTAVHTHHGYFDPCSRASQH